MKDPENMQTHTTSMICAYLDIFECSIIWSLHHKIYADKKKNNSDFQARIQTTATFASSRTLKNFVCEKSGKPCEKSGKHC